MLAENEQRNRSNYRLGVQTVCLLRLRIEIEDWYLWIQIHCLLRLFIQKIL